MPNLIWEVTAAKWPIKVLGTTGINYNESWKIKNMFLIADFINFLTKSVLIEVVLIDVMLIEGFLYRIIVFWGPCGKTEILFWKSLLLCKEFTQPKYNE